MPLIAGDLGVKVALEAAVEPAKMVGLAAAFRMGEEVGREVGRVSGGQAAAMAAAQELAKMNMDEITEEKAREVLRTQLFPKPSIIFWLNSFSLLLLNSLMVKVCILLKNGKKT